MVLFNSWRKFAIPEWCQILRDCKNRIDEYHDSDREEFVRHVLTDVLKLGDPDEIDEICQLLVKDKNEKLFHSWQKET